MTTLSLQLRLKREEGALVRLLGLVRRKRFDIVRLHAELAPDGDHLAVQVTVQTSRPGTSLVAHIEKLVDASHVEVIEPDENDRELRAAHVAS